MTRSYFSKSAADLICSTIGMSNGMCSRRSTRDQPSISWDHSWPPSGEYFRQFHENSSATFAAETDPGVRSLDRMNSSKPSFTLP